MNEETQMLCVIEIDKNRLAKMFASNQINSDEVVIIAEHRADESAEITALMKQISTIRRSASEQYRKSMLEIEALENKIIEARK